MHFSRRVPLQPPQRWQASKSRAAGEELIEQREQAAECHAGLARPAVVRAKGFGAEDAHVDGQVERRGGSARQAWQASPERVEHVAGHHEVQLGG